MYSYDDNGNMSSRAHNGSSYQQTFDFENRLVEVSDGAALVAEMTYDADGARIWQKAGLTTTVYINDLMEKAFC